MAALRIANAIAKSIEDMKNIERSKEKSAYMKGVVQVHGLTAAEMQQVVKFHRQDLSSCLVSDQKESIHQIVKTLMISPYHENKLVGINAMHHVCKKKLEIGDLIFLGKEIFDEKLAYDWATVDTISGKLIHHILINDGNHSESKACKELQTWANDFDNLWKQRASCVGMVKLARHGKHDDAVINVSKICVKSKERFVQLGVGWVLRELYLSDPTRTTNFIKENYNSFSREGLRYAIEKMNAELQDELLKYGREDMMRKQAAKRKNDDKTKSNQNQNHNMNQKNEPPKKKIKKSQSNTVTRRTVTFL